MKSKTMLLAALTAISVILPSHVRAQGTITFANSSSSLVVTSAPPVGTPVAKPGMGIQVQLYYGAIGSTEAQLVAAGSPTLVGVGIDGGFSGGTLTLSGIAANGSAVFQVRGWSGGYSSYEAALSANPNPSYFLYNASTMWTQATGGSSPAIPASMINGVGGFTGLVVVPEPSTYALLGLGLLGKVLRRKKQ